MNKYEMIYESLQSQLDQGLISEELANDVNDLAYDKYVMEGGRAFNNSADNYTDLIVKSKKKNREYNKTVKRLLKEGKMNQAVAVLKKEQIEIKMIIAKANKVEDGILDVVLGDLYNYVLNSAEDLMYSVVMNIASSIAGAAIDKATGIKIDRKELLKQNNRYLKLRRLIVDIKDDIILFKKAYDNYKKNGSFKMSDSNKFRARVIKHLNKLSMEIDNSIKMIQMVK